MFKPILSILQLLTFELKKTSNILKGRRQIRDRTANQGGMDGHVTVFFQVNMETTLQKTSSNVVPKVIRTEFRNNQCSRNWG